MKTAPTKRTLLALDAVNFLMADVHTGVGPFVAIYLALAALESIWENSRGRIRASWSLPPGRKGGISRLGGGPGG